jgi:photosystem II stability/assembly factor-like uncharacterized protein
MTIDHDDVRLTTPSPEVDPSVGDIKVLIKEARRRQRLRYLAVAIAFIVVLLAVVGISTLRGGPNAHRTTSSAPKRSQPTAIPPLPLKSKIWTLDMLSPDSGYAVAGVSSVKHDELLIKTTNEGQSWNVVGRLPYSFVAGQFKPLLDFVTPSIGYTQTFREGSKWVPNNIYVTTDGGKSWSKLHISGQVPSAIDAVADSSTSPDFRVSNGAISLVSLECTVATSNGTCPATLSEYHWGATTPFVSHHVSYLGAGSNGSSANTYLLAAPTAATALVAEGATTGGPFSFAMTTNAGATWTSVSNPCKPYPGAPGMNISGATLTSSRWILNCSQGTGMNHATVLLSESNNDGRTWSTINYTPAWSANAGAIAGEEDQVWTSNDGNVLWSYSLLGFIQVSTDGGRTWSPISVNGVLSNSNTGGGPIEFDPVGSTGAYFVTVSGQVLLTHNGTNFIPVRLLRNS